jgi:hypothetical protein
VIGHRRPIRALFVAMLSAALAALLVGGCAAHRLAQAQDAFSKAAEQENRLVPLATAPLFAYASPFSLYLQADAILTKDTSDKASDLKNDKLLATAYALHALTLWRLTDLSASADVVPLGPRAAAPAPAVARPPSEVYRRRAEEARRKALDPELKDQLGPRDTIMMTILPNLMDHDTGLQHLANRNWRRAHDFFADAFNGIDAAQARAPRGHDIRAYLWMVEIQNLVAWRSAVANGAAADGISDAAKETCRATWFIPKLQTAIAGLGALRKDGALDSRDDVWDSAFVRSRLQAAGLDVNTVKTNSIAAGRCEWK